MTASSLETVASLNNSGVQLVRAGRLREALDCYQLCIDELFELYIDGKPPAFQPPRPAATASTIGSSNSTIKNARERCTSNRSNSMYTPIKAWTDPYLPISLDDYPQDTGVFLFTRSILLKESSIWTALESSSSLSSSSLEQQENTEVIDTTTTSVAATMPAGSNTDSSMNDAVHDSKDSSSNKKHNLDANVTTNSTFANATASTTDTSHAITGATNVDRNYVYDQGKTTATSTSSKSSSPSMNFSWWKLLKLYTSILHYNKALVHHLLLFVPHLRMETDLDMACKHYEESYRQCILSTRLTAKTKTAPASTTPCTIKPPTRQDHDDINSSTTTTNAPSSRRGNYSGRNTQSTSRTTTPTTTTTTTESTDLVTNENVTTTTTTASQVQTLQRRSSSSSSSSPPQPLDLLVMVLFNNMGVLFCNEMGRFADASQCYKAVCGMLLRIDFFQPKEEGKNDPQPQQEHAPTSRMNMNNNDDDEFCRPESVVQVDELYMISMNIWMVPQQTSPAA